LPQVIDLLLEVLQPLLILPDEGHDCRLGGRRYPVPQSNGDWRNGRHATILRPLGTRTISACERLPLEAFQPLLELEAARGRAQRLRLYRHLLGAIATHRVAGRPDRFEPRLKKHRRNHYGWLTRPRREVKRDMAKGVTEI